jgi:hypothetical protein
MNLSNKTFRNNRTGETIKVIDSFESIVILENKQKIDIRNLLDTNQYTEQIDPSSFFNNQSAYNAIAEKLKSIPTENLVDESLKFGSEVRPAIEESAIIQTTEEDEIAELAKKYGVSTETNEEAVAKQKQAFSKYLDEDSEYSQPVTMVEKGVYTQPEELLQQFQQPVKREVEDPITTMFRNVKRSVEFKVNYQFSDKIPRLDFIEMMEDSYNISIIDFLTDEFTNKILENPSKIRENIKKEIKRLVYEKGTVLKKKTVQITKESNSEKKPEVNEETEIKKNSKSTTKERIELINKLNSIQNIEFQLKSERSKSVISAGNKRIEEIKNTNQL